jgi:hypothetical protein
MSKYKERGPYHFVEYADKNTSYHAHVAGLVDVLGRIIKVAEPNSIHEVGCGEGLILFKLWCAIGNGQKFSGNDVDDHAWNMARELLPDFIRVSVDHDITRATKMEAQVVIFSDSLEHIPNWMDHIEWAKQRARIIAIAVPSARDKHAINIFNPMDFDPLFVNGWKNEYRKTRDYRHVTIWVKQ